MRMNALLVLALTGTSGCLVSSGASQPRRGTVRDSPEPTAQPRYLEGVMIDAVTRQPLHRGAVDVTSPLIKGEMTVNTDEQGRFRTEELPPGEFKIRCRRNGYESINQGASITDGPARFDCEMQPKR